MKTIIFATGNAGKIREIKEIFKELDLTILSMKEAGVSADPEEDGESFEDNSIIKAKAVRKLVDESYPEPSQVLVMADDSGLEVDYLDKAPGIMSARFMGHNTSYDIKNNEILKRLEGVPDEKRTARFVCAVSAVFSGGEALVTRQTMEGRIGYEIEGKNGFGYDPIFIPDGYDVTSATISPEEKNKISHRGKALRSMLKMIRDRL
ncbi:MAG: RdgB/HAM1 family non-canonical purine NTP pyrophosphatase [Lachnospiraceae bacterium]|nr:RdgB/HAM1 family non-canonical purine NTP pyrophosphatase [Lachnospiraceae bacterium]